MRRSGRLFIVLGVGLALVAGLLAFVALSGGDPEEDPASTTAQDTTEPREITVITATRDIPAHERIGEDDIEEQVVDASTISGDAVTSRLAVIGLAYGLDLVPGQPLLQAQVESPGLANRIEPGRRAFALPVDAAGMLGGLIRDEDHLDVVFNTRVGLTRVSPSWPFEATDALTVDKVKDPETGEEGLAIPPYGEQLGPTYPYPGEAGSRFLVSDLEDGDPTTKVLLQNVRVLRVVQPAAAEAGGNAEDSGNFLILDVSPQEAEILRFMVENGTYQVILRGLEDEEIVSTDGLTYNRMVDDLGLPVPKTVRLPGAEAQ